MIIRATRPAKAAFIFLGLGFASSVQAELDDFPTSYPAFWKEWEQRPYSDAWLAARDREAAEAAQQAQLAHPHPHTQIAEPTGHGNAAYAEELALRGGPRQHLPRAQDTSAHTDGHVTAAHAAAHPEHATVATDHHHQSNNYNAADVDKYHECAALLQNSASRVDSIESRLLAGNGYTQVQPATEAPALIVAETVTETIVIEQPTLSNGIPLAETFPVEPGQVVVEQEAQYISEPVIVASAETLPMMDTQSVVAAPRTTTNRIDYPDGSFYRGDISAERRHGYGVMTWPDGTRYLGQFFNDQYHGHGQLRWSDGTSYTGAFLHDQLEGRGTIVWQDGLKFQGEMETNQRHGKGTYTLPDGRRVVGVFTNDRPAGTGILIYPDGRHEPIQFGKDVNIKHDPLKFCNYASMPGCP